MLLNVNNPSTFYIKFTGEIPKFFCLYDQNGEMYYFRYLDGKTPRIKFNIPDAGNYNGNVPFQVVKQVGIEIPKFLPKLPPANRDRWKPLKFIYNPNMNTRTPIRIFTETGVVEAGPRFMSFIKPVKLFLELHERGHLFYTDEENCDLYALVAFVRLGYNQSTGLYTLSHVLSRTPENVGRVKALFNNIQKMKSNG